jgi:hypothetical protein
MYQSVVEYDVAPCPVTPVLQRTQGQTSAAPSVELPPGANAAGLQGARRAVQESLVSYMAVVGMAFGLVAAWAALCAI